MSQTQKALYEWSVVDGVAVARPLMHELTEPSISTELGVQLQGLFDSGQHRLVLDLTPIRYMSSSAFGTIAGLARRVLKAGGVLKIFGMDPMVRMGADIIRLGELVPIYQTEDDALSTF